MMIYDSLYIHVYWHFSSSMMIMSNNGQTFITKIDLFTLIVILVFGCWFFFDFFVWTWQKNLYIFPISNSILFPFHQTIGKKLDPHHCEALEEILKRVLFRLIDLDSCDLDCDVSLYFHSFFLYWLVASQRQSKKIKI